VAFTGSLLADLARRDFTINAMAVDVEDRQLLDPFGGMEVGGWLYDEARGSCCATHCCFCVLVVLVVNAVAVGVFPKLLPRKAKRSTRQTGETKMRLPDEGAGEVHERELLV
jgi:Poly A polymerase head domain